MTLVNASALYRKYAVRNKLVHEIHDLIDIFGRILVEVINKFAKRRTLGSPGESHRSFSPRAGVSHRSGLI